MADLDIEVRGHAVIIGENDVGKASLLRLPHTALGAGTAQIYTYLGPDDLRDPALPLTSTHTGMPRPEGNGRSWRTRST